MWRCNHCGSADIQCDVSATTNDINSIGELETDVISEMEFIEYEFYCNDCDNFSDNIEDIAEWIEKE